jgi:hypothetical protein
VKDRQVAFLDEVVERQSEAAVAHGKFSDYAAVGKCDASAGVEIACLGALQELAFLFKG